MTHPLDVHRDQLRAALGEFFHVEDDLLLGGLESDLEFLSLAAGDNLFREGDASDAICFVVAGRLRAVHERDEASDLVGEIARGETVGELGLVTGEPRSATIVAVRNSLVARMSRATFERVLAGRPQVSIAVMRTIVERFRRSGRARRARGRPVTLCVAPISERVDARDLAERLREILGRYEGHVSTLSARDLDAFSERERAQAGEPGSAIGDWLDAAEAASSTLILVADRDATPWSQACLSRADEIVLLARADAEPRISGLEAYCLADEAAEFAPAQTLVLVHDETTRSPTGTAAWLDRRAVGRHVHVRPALERDMCRLARIVSGRAIGLVLSGGGGKAFAHLGILNALAEGGIEPDFIGGAGIGALMAAWRALDHRGEGLVAAGRDAFLDGGAATQGRYVPMASLLRGMKSRQRVERAVLGLADPDVQIEDTWLTSFCVVGNHAASAEVAVRRGPLARSVLASYAIPGILPSAAFDGPLYVDGGTVNNLPLDVLERLGAGAIVAIDLRPEDSGGADVEMIPGTLALLLDRLRRPSKRRYSIPNLPDPPRGETALRPLRRDNLRDRPDLVVSPSFERLGDLDGRGYDAMVARGHASALKQLAALPPERLEFCR